jgi:hypothetical protein
MTPMAWYCFEHVTSCGNAQQDIVVDDKDRTRFLTLLTHVIDRYC